MREDAPDFSYKGGMPGFVRVTGPSEFAFPDYDGNGMFKSLGNILFNPSVGILFIATHGKSQRLRVDGEATVSDRDPLVGAQLIIRCRRASNFSELSALHPDHGAGRAASIYRRDPGAKRLSRPGFPIYGPRLSPADSA